MVLSTSLYEHWRSNDEFGNTATLVALQPFLTGQIREHVDYVIEHPDHEMWAMPFYSAAQDRKHCYSTKPPGQLGGF
jgi:hypothetical protein